MEKSLNQIAMEALASDVCICGGAKVGGGKNPFPFCTRCWVELPRELQRRLWRGGTQDFAVAWDEARDFLRIHTNRIRAKQESLFGARP